MKFMLSPQLVDIFVVFLLLWVTSSLLPDTSKSPSCGVNITCCQDVISLSRHCATPAFPFIQTLVLLLLYLQSGPTTYASVTFTHTVRCNWGTMTLCQTSCVKGAINTLNCNHYSLLKSPHPTTSTTTAERRGRKAKSLLWVREHRDMKCGLLRKCILTALVRSTLQHRCTTATKVGDDSFHSTYFLFICLQQRGFCLPGRGFFLSEPSLSSTASFPNHS